MYNALNKILVTIYVHNFSKPLSSSVFEDYLLQFPNAMGKKIMRYRKWEDRHRALFGKIMLRRGLDEHGLKGFDLKDLTYNKLQKPQLPGAVQFNISHAGNVVICAFNTEGLIGVDVEIIKPIILEDYEFIFDTDTVRQLRQARDQEGAFFEAWTIREAILKAEGSGLTEDAKKIIYKDGAAKFKNQEWFIKPFPVPKQHIAHLATKAPVGTLKLVKV